MFRMLTLKIRSAVNMWHNSRCFAQMLVMGFLLARLEKLPKTSEWQGLRREHRSPIAAPALTQRALRYLVWVLQEGISLLKQFFFWKCFFFFFLFCLQRCHSFKEHSRSICSARMNLLLKIKVWGKQNNKQDKTKSQPHQQPHLTQEGLGTRCHTVPWLDSYFKWDLIFPCC